jgi:geranylgeranyl pyrophosphate synthase
MTKEKHEALKFHRFIANRSLRIEKLLRKYLAILNSSGPKGLCCAIEYSLLGEGKRFRPLLVYAIGQAYGTSLMKLDSSAVALELVHTFSLIHDDLPAMDNDTLRRGKLTLHLAFDEATAILAGDALLAMALQVVGEDNKLTIKQRVMMLNILSQTCGARGMVGGQYIDMHPTMGKVTKRYLNKLYILKTGELIRAALQLGAIASDIFNRKKLQLLGQLAYDLGIFFQLQDDIANVIGDTKQIGKNVGTDRQQNKLTYPALMGITKAKNELLQLMDSIAALLEQLQLQESFIRPLFQKLLAKPFLN